MSATSSVRNCSPGWPLPIGRLLASAVLCLALPACWHDPQPPNDGSTDAYGWSALLDVPGADSYYRLAVHPDLDAWMKARGITAFSVFDATGTPQVCGLLSGQLWHPLSSTPRAIAAHVSPFDDTVCGKVGHICFKDRPCTVPDFCSPQTVDLSDTPLEGITSAAEIEAIAEAKLPLPPACRDFRPDATRPCGPADTARLSDIRQADARRTAARSFIANYGPVAEEPATATRAPAAAHSDSRDLLVTLDSAPSQGAQLTFRWNKAASLGRLGTATRSCYYRGGTPQGERIDIQGSAAENGGTLEVVPACTTRLFRLTIEPSVPDLALVGVSVIDHEPKPFMAGDVPQYWVAPRGTPPYALFLEPGHGGCGAGPNQIETARLPRLHDADWPPAATVAQLPTVHARSLWTRWLASRSPWLPWLFWLLYVGGICVVALTATLARWAWLARSRPPVP